jgi:hypothetical protein
MSRRTFVFPASLGTPDTTFPERQLFFSGLLLLFAAHDTLPRAHRASFVFGPGKRVLVPAFYLSFIPTGAGAPSSGFVAALTRRVRGVSRLNCRIL